MKLVCPYNPALIDRLECRTICVRVENPTDIAAAAAAARQRNALACVICEAHVPLEDMEIEDTWRDVPLALMLPSVGRVRHLVKKLEALGKLNLRVYLSAAPENLIGARILASLGIAACIDVDRTGNWEGLADLMTYALLGLVPHAPIEPFRSIADGYHRTARSDDWGRIYFDDPAHYLHLNTEGRIALSRRELLAGDFAAENLSLLDSPDLKRAAEERCDSWRELFAENHFCVRCDAWRICRARLRSGKTEPDGCAVLFRELADVIEQRRGKSVAGVQLWQH